MRLCKVSHCYFAAKIDRSSTAEISVASHDGMDKLIYSKLNLKIIVKLVMINVTNILLTPTICGLINFHLAFDLNGNFKFRYCTF